jgi:hypothetical protein
LIAAAERKDANFIHSILDPKIELSFGGDSGIPTFKRMWKIESKNTKFWAEFLPVIKNGGTFDRVDGKRRVFSLLRIHSILSRRIWTDSNTLSFLGRT